MEQTKDSSFKQEEGFHSKFKELEETVEQEVRSYLFPCSLLENSVTVRWLQPAFPLCLTSQRKAREAERQDKARMEREMKQEYEENVRQLQEEHARAIRAERARLSEEQSNELERVKQDVSQNAGNELETRLGLMRSQLDELGRRESRLLSHIESLKSQASGAPFSELENFPEGEPICLAESVTQVEDAKNVANSEYKKRKELEGALRVSIALLFAPFGRS